MTTDNHQLQPLSETPKPAGLKKKLEDAAKALRPRDLDQLVEQYTSDFTLVAEGLSEDLVSCQTQSHDNAALITQLEDRVSTLDQQVEGLVKSQQDLKRQLDDKRRVKASRQGLVAVLRQATWLAAIVCGSWLVITLIRQFGGK